MEACEALTIEVYVVLHANQFGTQLRLVCCSNSVINFMKANCCPAPHISLENVLEGKIGRNMKVCLFQILAHTQHYYRISYDPL